MPLNGRRLFDYAELLLAVILWGSLYPSSKPALAELSAVQVALVRAVIAFLTLGGLVLIRGKGAEALAELLWRPWPSASLGLLSFLLSSLLAMLAVRYLPASVVGMIIATSPLWLSLAAIALRRPQGSGRMLLGAAIALTGVGMVLFRGEGGTSALPTGEGLDSRGVIFALLCSVVIALQAAWGRRVMLGRDPVVITCLGCGWSIPPLLALAATEGGVAPLLATSQPIQGLLLYLGIGCTAINFAFFNHALKRVPAERAAAFQYLIPFLSALFSFVFLEEAITWQLLVGGVAIIAGVVLTQERQEQGSPEG